MNKRFLELSCGRIAMLESGSDSNQLAVLFIHGNSSCKEVFRHQFASQLAERYRFISFDLPGHGESSDAIEAEKFYTQPAYADIAIEVMQHCQVHRFIVVGWSLGGHIGIEIMNKYKGLIGLAMSGTPPAGPGLEEVNKAFTPQPHMAFTSKEVFSGEEAEIYAKYTCGINLPPDPTLVNAVKRTDGRARRIMWDYVTVQNMGCPQREVIENTVIPVAVIQGGDEAFFSNDYFETLSFGNLWGGKIHIIENAGHAPFWERPDQYNVILERFIKDLS